MRREIEVVGYVYASDQNGAVLDTQGVSSCLGCGAHGGVEPKIKITFET